MWPSRTVYFSPPSALGSRRKKSACVIVISRRQVFDISGLFGSPVNHRLPVARPRVYRLLSGRVGPVPRDAGRPRSTGQGGPSPWGPGNDRSKNVQKWLPGHPVVLHFRGLQAAGNYPGLHTASGLSAFVLYLVSGSCFIHQLLFTNLATLQFEKTSDFFNHE